MSEALNDLPIIYKYEPSGQRKIDRNMTSKNSNFVYIIWHHLNPVKSRNVTPNVILIRSLSQFNFSKPFSTNIAIISFLLCDAYALNLLEYLENIKLTSVDFLDFVESFDFFLSLGDFLTLRQALLIHRLGARADGCGFDGREPILKTSNFHENT